MEFFLFVSPSPAHIIAIYETAGKVLFFFAIYSFFGWMIENTYHLFANGSFFKPNFFFGPFKPMYGIAPLLLLFLLPEETSIAYLLILCLFIPTLVEYFSGIILERLTGKKWWDYSNHRFQFQGHICLSFSFCWLFLSLLCVKFVHPFMLYLFEEIFSDWDFIWPVLFIYFQIEIIFVLRKHLALKRAVKRME